MCRSPAAQGQPAAPPPGRARRPATLPYGARTPGGPHRWLARRGDRRAARAQQPAGSQALERNIGAVLWPVGTVDDEPFSRK